MRKYTAFMFATVALALGVPALHAQVPAVNAAIIAELGVAPVAFWGNGTPNLVDGAGNPATETNMRNIIATIGGVASFVVTTNAFAAPINWGHDADVIGGAAGEISVATGPTIGTVTADANAFANCSAYSVAGHGAAPNGNGGNADAISIGSDDCIACAGAGNGVGTGNGGSATGN